MMKMWPTSFNAAKYGIIEICRNDEAYVWYKLKSLVLIETSWDVRNQFYAAICVDFEGFDVLADGCEETKTDFLEKDVKHTFVGTALK